MANILETREIIQKLTDEGLLPTVTLHMLFPVTNALPNRDDTGAQKSILLDVLRMRISSQAIKKPLVDQIMVDGSFRTRLISDYICDRYKHDHENISEEEWKLLCDTLKALLGKASNDSNGESSSEEEDNKDKKKTDDKVAIGQNPDIKTQILFYSAKDTENLYNAVNEVIQAALEETVSDADKKKKTDARAAGAAKKIRKQMEATTDTRGITPAIALVGRMSTDSMLRTVYSAMRVSHAYSVTEMAGETDFYTAVDDYHDPKYRFLHSECKDAGVAQMDNRDINSAIMYSCFSINMRTLVENMMREMEDTSQASVDHVLNTARALVGHVAELITDLRPNTAQTSMQSNADPNALAVVISNTYGKTADNAFQRVIPRKDADRVSIERLRNWLDDDNFRPSYEKRVGYWTTLNEFKDIEAPEGYQRIRTVDLRGILEKGVKL